MGMSTDGHPFFNFAEYNLYPVVVKGEETLADILNSMSLSPDDYQYGTDPGFVNDFDKWQSFYDLYLKAMQYVADGTHSDEEMDALKEQFVAAAGGHTQLNNTNKRRRLLLHHHSQPQVHRQL